MPWTIQSLLLWTTNYFTERKIASPRLDAELLLAFSLNYPRVKLYTDYDQPLQEVELKKFKLLLQRRAQREPLAYILGKKEFYGLDFEVTPEVLIPRPETELLVERGLAHLKEIDEAAPKVLDIATGSGCILISLAKHFPRLQGTGLDIASGSLEVAERNRGRLIPEKNLTWQESDLRNPDWTTPIETPVALLTANLPYVSESDYATLEPELREHEPRRALVPGTTGLESFHWVFPHLDRILATNGLALFEIGSDQEESLAQLVQDQLPERTAYFEKDWAGHSRLLILK